jgi:hypothetical protein
MAKIDNSKIFKLSAKEIELRIKRGQPPFGFKNTDDSSSYATPTSQKSPAGKLRDEGGSAARKIELQKEKSAAQRFKEKYKK